MAKFVVLDTDVAIDSAFRVGQRLLTSGSFPLERVVNAEVLQLVTQLMDDLHLDSVPQETLQSVENEATKRLSRKYSEVMDEAARQREKIKRMEDLRASIAAKEAADKADIARLEARREAVEDFISARISGMASHVASKLRGSRGVPKGAEHKKDIVTSLRVKMLPLGDSATVGHLAAITEDVAGELTEVYRNREADREADAARVLALRYAPVTFHKRGSGWSPGRSVSSRISNWKDAEENAAGWMRSIGFHGASMTASGADGGIDVNSVGAVAQVKREQGRTGRVAIQNLVGASSTPSHAMKERLFFSWSGYSQTAVAFADEAGVCLFEYDDAGIIKALNRHAHRMLRQMGDRSR